MDIDAQISDTLGALDGFHAPAHDDADSIRALSAKLRYLEQRRYHDALALSADESREALLTHLSDISGALKVMLAKEAPSNAPSQD